MRALSLFVLLLWCPSVFADGITQAETKAWESSVDVQAGHLFYFDATYDALCYNEFTTFDNSDGGLLRLRKFNKVSKTWDTNVTEIYSNPSANPNTYVCRVIGSQVHVVLTRRLAGGTFKDVVYFKSTDMTMTSWTSPTVMYVFPPTIYGARRGNVHGEFVYIAEQNKYMVAFYSHDGAQTPGSWRDGFFYSTDDAATWTLDETAIYGSHLGNIKWGEVAIAYAGECRLIALIRNQNGNTNVGQSVSTDCGENWTNPDSDFTNIGAGLGGAGNPIIPNLYYDPNINRLIAAVHDRGTGQNKTKVHIASPENVIADPDNWGDLVFSIDNYFAAGYPTINKIDSDEYMIVYFREDITPNTASNRNKEDLDAKYVIYQINQGDPPDDPNPPPDDAEQVADYGGVTVRGLTFG